MRRVVLILCVLLLATVAVTASAATRSVKVEDHTLFTCGGAVAPTTSTSSTTSTTTTTNPTGCSVSTICPKKNDDPNHPNDTSCDGNNGGGNG